MVEAPELSYTRHGTRASKGLKGGNSGPQTSTLRSRLHLVAVRSLRKCVVDRCDESFVVPLIRQSASAVNGAVRHRLHVVGFTMHGATAHLPFVPVQHTTTYRWSAASLHY